MPKKSIPAYDIEAFRKRPFSLSGFEGLLYHYREILGFNWGIEVDTASDCAWAAEIRITPEPNNCDGPDVSTVLFIAGQPGPVEAVKALIPATLDIIEALLKKRNGSDLQNAAICLQKS